MKASSEHDKAIVVAGLVEIEAVEQPKDARLLPESEYLRCVAKMIRYLSLYSAGAPDVAAMSPEERQRYVLGYGLPFIRAGIPSDAFWTLGEGGKGGFPGEALIRWTERPGQAFFPRKPGEIVEICEVVQKEKAPGWKPPLALDPPPPSREERNRQRIRLGLDPLPDLT